MQIIDHDLTQDQFTRLDLSTIILLIEAVERDLTTWAARLGEAVAAGRGEDILRARHALTGLCDAFGAAALRRACLDGPPDSIGPICAATIVAIREAAFIPQD